MTGSVEGLSSARGVDSFLAHCSTLVRAPAPLNMRGRLTRVAGVVMEAVGLRLPVGAICTVTKGHGLTVEAEVVGFANDRLFLMPVSETWGLTPGAWVIPNEPQISLPRLNEPAHPLRRVEDHTRHLPVGDALLGRVLDPNGKPLDRLGALGEVQLRPLRSRTINPIDREPIRSTLDVGIRAINALLCVGRGQRLGLFAGSGVGKSVLLGMMTRYTTADVTVVALIGERGREVKEFIDETLGPAGMARSIVVAAPADSPPLMRLQGAAYATAIAEYYRDQGKNVLLLMDSLTRYCMAQREIALAIGEPPATKGYPPSVFTRLPSLVERAGNGINGHGSITAFYTVLAEGDDQQDPIADHARAILDGHIVLSRTLAEQGHYPAIDIEQSVSRVMPNVADARHIEATRQFRQLYSRFQRNRDMINLGAYKTGADPILDQAILLHPQMEAFLQQPMQQRADLASSIADLGTLLGSPLSPAIPS